MNSNPTLHAVAEHLSQNDLYSFSLLARDFARAGQHTLYRHPVVPPLHNTKKDNQTFTFLRTVLQNPVLAAKVTSLDLFPRRIWWQVRDVDVEGDVLYIDAPQRLGNILEHASIQVSEFAVTGAILRNLPNLESLRYELYSSGGGLVPILNRFNWCFAEWPIGNMFGAGTDLSRIPALKNLKRLRFTAGHIEHQWCELPKLEYVYVGFDSDMDSAGRSPQASPVRTMGMECSSWALHKGGFYDEMDDFFKCFSQLTHLTLHMFNELDTGQLFIYSSNEEDCNDSMTDNLIAHLQQVAPVLRALRILVYDDPTQYLDPEDGEPILWQWTQLPARDWESFKELRHLEVPCGMFIIERELGRHRGPSNPCATQAATEAGEVGSAVCSSCQQTGRVFGSFGRRY